MIQTRLVNEVVIAYREWYRPEVGCVCNNDPDYTIDMNGVPLPGVCSFHEWQHKRQQLQQEIVQAGLSLPITKQEGINPPGYKKGKINPIHREPLTDRLTNRGAAYAARIARTLAEEHIVFYMDRTKLINLSYGQRDQEVEDLMLYSPVLVYHSNYDKRANGRDEALLLSRQYGYCYVVK